MYGIAKNIWKYLVKSETLLYFVVRDSDHQIVEHIFNADKAYPCDPTFGWSLSRKQKGIRSLFVHTTKLLIQKCETAKKLVVRRIIVPEPHLLFKTTSLKCAISASQDRHSSEPNSRMKSRLTKSESPEYGMMPKNSISRICTTSIIPSWLWAEPLWSFTSAIPRVR